MPGARIACRVFAVVLCLLASAPAVAAPTIVANGTNCTLTDAIRAANLDATVGGCHGEAGTDQILLTYDVTLSSPDLAHGAPFNVAHDATYAGLPVVIQTLTITGDGAGHTIQRNPGYGCAASDPNAFRLLTTSANLTLTRLTFRNGCASGTHSRDWGGAIFVEEGRTLTVDHCTFIDNTARGTQDVRGGAIAFRLDALTTSKLVVTNSTFIHNVARSSQQARGGAIAIDRARDQPAVRIHDSRFEDNLAESGGNSLASGGAVHTSDSGIWLLRVLFDRNKAIATGGTATGVGAYGGAVTLEPNSIGALSEINSVVFRGNEARAADHMTAQGGALRVFGNRLETLTGCLFESNVAQGGNGTASVAAGAAEGGGLFVNSDISTLKDSTFNANVARGGTYANPGGGAEGKGGGFCLCGSGGRTVTAMRNVTFSHNVAEGGFSHGSGHGGAMAVSGNTITKLSHATMKDNRATHQGTGTQQGGGLWISGSSVTTENLVLADNTPNDCSASAGQYVSLGHNFMETHDSASSRPCPTHANDTLGEITAALQPLADNGCVTKLPVLGTCLPTIGLLRSNSLLIELIDKGRSGATTDARGHARPHDYPGKSNPSGQNGVDPGAFELTPPTISGLGGVSFTENGPAVRIAPDASASYSDHFNGGLLKVTISTPTENHLRIETRGAGATKIEHIGSSVHYGALIIGSVFTSGGFIEITFPAVGVAPTVTHEAVTALLQAITFEHSGDTPPATLTSTVELKASSDSLGANGSIHSHTITLHTANDAPAIAATAGTTPFTEGTAATVDNGLAITDVDSTNLIGATATITNLLDGTSEVLTVTLASGITSSYDSNTGVLTLSRPTGATLAAFQGVMRTIAYNNTSNTPTAGNRTIAFQVNDGGAVNHLSNIATKTVSVSAANDAPAVTTTGGTTPFTEDGGAVVVDGGVTATDVDSAFLTQATVTISTLPDTGSEVLAAPTQLGGVSVTYTAPTLTISGTASLANYQTMLRAVTYINTSQNPTTTNRTLTFVINDGVNPSPGATKTVSVAAVNDGPGVTASAGTTPFVEGAGAVLVDTGLTVTDPDSSLTATVTLTNPLNSGEILAAPTQFGVSANWVSPTLTFSASTTAANFQAILRTVTYNNPSTTPTTTNRVITFTINDGTAPAVTANKTVTVGATNNIPVVTTTGTTTSFTEDGGAVTIDTGITVSDLDSPNLAQATVTITNLVDAGAEVLVGPDLTLIPGVTASYIAPTLTISGSTTLVNYQNILRAVTYNNTSHNPTAGNRTLAFVVSDGSYPSTASNKTVSITPVNDASAVTASIGASSFSEGTAATVDPALTITDVDSPTLSGATVTITNVLDTGLETLAAPTLLGSATANYVAPTLTFTGSATLANYQAMLRAVTYNDTSSTPNTTTRSISFRVNDGGAVNNLSNVTSKSVSIGTTDNAPVVTASGGTTGFTEDGGAAAIDGGLTVSDVDSTNFTQATVTITNLLDAGLETLTAPTLLGGVTASYTAPTLTLTGSTTLANYQTMLRAVAYNNASDHPSTTNRSIAFIVNDGTLSSTASNKSLSVTPVNDPPSLRSLDGTVRTYVEDQASPVRIAANDSSIADPDLMAEFSGGRLEVEIESSTTDDQLSIQNEGTGAGQIGFVSGTTVTYGNVTIGTVAAATSGANGQRLVINLTTSQATTAAIDTLLRAVTYSSGNVPRSVRTARFVFVDGDGGSETSAPARATINVTPVNDAPSFGSLGGTDLGYRPEDLEKQLDPDATLADPELAVLDSGNGNWGGAMMTVKRNTGADATDDFSFLNSATLTESGNTLRISGVTRATFEEVAGLLTIRFAEGTTTAHANEIVRAIRYRRLQAITASITLEYTIDDGNTGAQGTGGAKKNAPGAGVTLVAGTGIDSTVTIFAPAASLVGEPITVSVSVIAAGPVPAGFVDVDFADGTEAPQTITLSGGIGQTTLTAMKAGARSITATYRGSPTHTTRSAAPASLTVGKAETTTTVTAPASSTAVSSLEVTVTATPKSPSTAALPDAVTVTATASGGRSKTCDATVASARKCTLSDLTGGDWTVTAAYPTTTDYVGSSGQTTHTVARVGTTIAFETHTPAFSVVNQGVFVVVRVTATGATAGVPEGKVIVTDDNVGVNQARCEAFLVSGLASCSLTPRAAGDRILTAVYETTDHKHQPGTPATVSHRVELAGARATTTAIAISPASSTYGTAITATVTVTVTGSTTKPAGSFEVRDHAGTPVTGTLNANGVGTVTLTPGGGGVRTILATYLGTVEFAGSATSTGYTVNPATTLLGISAIPDPNASALTRITVTVTSSAGTPAGIVTIGNGTLSCTPTLNAGTASCSLALPAGTHALNGLYPGSAEFATASNSMSYTVVGTTGTRVRGDVNGDGFVRAGDASMVLQFLVGTMVLTSAQQCAADFDGSGGPPTAGDAARILTCVVNPNSCTTATCN